MQRQHMVDLEVTANSVGEKSTENTGVQTLQREGRW